MISRWTPADLLQRAETEPLDEFVAWCETPYVLLVVDPTGEIAEARAAHERSSDAPDNSAPTEMGFQQAPELLTGERPPQATTGTQHGVFAALPIASQALDQPNHVVLLRGRPGRPGCTKVTVGRGSDRDVMIKHRSLSRSHAWLEFDRTGHLFLGDLNSTNHTFVNGTKVIRPVEVHPGCHLRFGSIAAFIYRPQSLWEAVHQQ